VTRELVQQKDKGGATALSRACLEYLFLMDDSDGCESASAGVKACALPFCAQGGKALPRKQTGGDGQTKEQLLV
jgi:hypothetical protein